MYVHVFCISLSARYILSLPNAWGVEKITPNHPKLRHDTPTTSVRSRPTRTSPSKSQNQDNTHFPPFWPAHHSSRNLLIHAYIHTAWACLCRHRRNPSPQEKHATTNPGPSSTTPVATHRGFPSPRQPRLSSSSPPTNTSCYCC